MGHGDTMAQAPSGGDQRIVLLVDSGNQTTQRINDFRNGLMAFVDEVAGNPEIALLTTGGRMQVRLPPTTDRSLVRKAVQAFAPEGGANAFERALLEAYRRFFEKVEDKTPIFVILTTEATAGRFEFDIEAYNRDIEVFVQRGGRAYAIVVGGLERGLTTDVARHISVSSGGHFERIGNSAAVTKILKGFAAEISALQQR